jgi:DNA-binding response OmpR family regulator
VAVAEPDAALRRLLVAKLLDGGYEVYEAATGGELVELCVPHGPAGSDVDLVIVDQAIDDPSGLDLVRLLRAAGRRDPVILTTRAASPWLSAHAKRLAATIVTKPYALDVLSTLVRAALLLQPPRRGRYRLVP